MDGDGFMEAVIATFDGYVRLTSGVVELSSGLPKTNPASGREEDLNPGPPDYKSSALTTKPCFPFYLGFG